MTKHRHEWRYVHAVWEGLWIARWCAKCDAVQASQAKRWREPPTTHPDLVDVCRAERRALRGLKD